MVVAGEEIHEAFADVVDAAHVGNALSPAKHGRER
jgi:hypothetical protein